MNPQPLRSVPSLFLLGTLLGCTDVSPATPGGTTEPPPTGSVEIRLQRVASGLEQPVYLTAPAGDARLFVVEQPGRIRVLREGRLLPTPFLDLSGKVSCCGERGLLSVAFHPRYAQTGFLYVNYTDRRGDTQIERYSVSRTDPDRADAGSARIILSVAQPYPNHNGGLVKFGPDGMFYIGMGDGGAAGDPENHGQRRETLLGDLLRLDVDRGDPYAIPADNPFRSGQGGARPEIWATGLRNPWRFSFDQEAGTLYIADVGQNEIEEINAVPARSAGLNYGWKIMEGSECFSPRQGCNREGLVLPVAEYRHSRGEGCSVTGGYVYRGRALPELRGTYFYSDFCQGGLRSFRLVGGRATEARSWPVGELGNVSSFGEDAAGELYVISHGGQISRLGR